VRRAAALPLFLVLVACAAPGGSGSSPSAQEPAQEPAAVQVPPDEREHPPALPAPVSLPSEPGEAGVRAFLEEFMEARVRGDQPRARDFLSSTALEQYGQGGLPLTGTEGARLTRWELVSLNAADASSWEVKVRLHPESGTPAEETLFIGPGPDTSETQRAWIVRGAMRS
jgi:hypothetical protein